MNSQFTVDGLSKADGSPVAVGSSFTLLCDHDHTFKNQDKLIQSCVKGLASNDINNECFSESISIW